MLLHAGRFPRDVRCPLAEDRREAFHDSPVCSIPDFGCFHSLSCGGSNLMFRHGLAPPDHSVAPNPVGQLGLLSPGDLSVLAESSRPATLSGYVRAEFLGTTELGYGGLHL